MSVISDMVQDVYQLIQDRVTQETDNSVATETVELCEDFLISHTYEWAPSSNQFTSSFMTSYSTVRLKQVNRRNHYSVLFGGLASEEETRDLGVLQRIRSLHWVRAGHLDLDIDDIHPTVKEFMDEAMKQLIFIDSKRSPKCVRHPKFILVYFGISCSDFLPTFLSHHH